jgi:hypothetical protein
MEARMNAFEERILGGMTPMEACLDLVPDGTITDAMEECKRLAREAVLKAHPEYTDATVEVTSMEKGPGFCHVNVQVHPVPPPKMKIKLNISLEKTDDKDEEVE